MTRSKSKTNKEYMLLDHIKQWTGSSQIGDDCAVLPNGLLASVDTLVEDVHFARSTASFFDIGWKACAVNLSDIAAMAGRPRVLLVSLTLPSNFSLKDIKELYRGILECARRFRVKVEGGDLSRGEKLSVSITVFGDTHELGVLKRNGASLDDFVIATGDFGASKAGLYALTEMGVSSNYCVDRHLRPEPRFCEAWALLRAVTKADSKAALMDASDGLADAVFQIAQASNLGISIESEKVPVDKETEQMARHACVDPLDWALYGGEDFELVACVDLATWEHLNSDSELNPFQVIGIVKKDSTVVVRQPDGQEVAIDPGQSFQHFNE